MQVPPCAETAYVLARPRQWPENLARFGRQYTCVRARNDAKRFVYVLKTQEYSPRYYVGVTSNVEQRLAWHNQGRCAHTAKYRPWRFHVIVEFSDEAHATRFEQYLKSGSGRAFAKRHFD